MGKKDPRIPDGVTLENAVWYLEAIQKATEEDIQRVGPGERSLILGILSGVMFKTAQYIAQMRSMMELSGRADPVSEEQKAQLREIFKVAKTPES